MSAPGLSPDIAKAFDRIFSELFRTADRTLPLVVIAGYRGQPRRMRQVVYRRAVACVPCKGAGCRSCAYVGWIVVDEKLDVEVPEGSAAGTRLRLPGMGDGVRGAEAKTDLVVELVEEGSERATTLERANETYETSLPTRLAEATRARARERKNRFLGLGALAVGIASLPALFLVSHLMKAKVGESCERSDDCRSERCTTFAAARFTGRAELLGPGAGLQLCTQPCDSDADCPSDTTCALVEASGGRLRPDGYRSRLCMPTK